MKEIVNIINYSANFCQTNIIIIIRLEFKSDKFICNRNNMNY